jgi:hypothetical protein
LDELVKARFVELFGDPVANPFGWRKLTVQQAIDEKIIDKPLDGNHGGKHPKTSDYAKEGIPFILVPDLVDGKVDLDNCNYITEEQAKRFCIERNAYSPHYKYSERDGCVLCYNAKPKERQIWLNDYPQAYVILLELQNKLKPLLVGRKNEYPLRGYKHFIEIPPLLQMLGVEK